MERTAEKGCDVVGKGVGIGSRLEKSVSVARIVGRGTIIVLGAVHSRSHHNSLGIVGM